jgi:hypothetical protein
MTFDEVRDRVLEMHPLLAHCYLGLGRLSLKIGRGEQARAELATTTELYRAMEMTFWLLRAEGLLAQVEGS